MKTTTFPIKALPILLKGVHHLFNPMHPITAVLGRLIDYDELLAISANYQFADGESFTPADAIMLCLAELGPEEIFPGVDPRGVYAPENITHR